MTLPQAESPAFRKKRVGIKVRIETRASTFEQSFEIFFPLAIYLSSNLERSYKHISLAMSGPSW